MIRNNNLSCLPWYLSIDEQNHRRSYAYGKVYPLYTPANSLLPFQIIRDHRNNAVTQVRLYKKTGELVSTITSLMNNTGLQVVSFTDYDVIVYTSTAPMGGTDWLDGQYYCTLTDGVQTWYSEVFTIVHEMSPYLKLEWWDVENIVFDDGAIVYDNPKFRNRLYFCAELGKPDYPFEEEGEERDGYFFAEKQISEKRYKFQILAPEYMCDVLRLVRLADYVKITDKYGRVYYCDTFLASPKWQGQGDLASVDVEFDTDTVVKKLGVGFYRPVGGDFNDDYNDDYNNQ